MSKVEGAFEFTTSGYGQPDVKFLALRLTIVYYNIQTRTTRKGLRQTYSHSIPRDSFHFLTTTISTMTEYGAELLRRQLAGKEGNWNQRHN